MNAQLKVQCRWMIRRDLPEVMRIEQQSFEYPWTEEDFVQTLAGQTSIGMVAETDGRIVGFMLYELQAISFRILNFAACPKRHGIGTQMVGKLIAKLGTRTKLTLEVRETNLAAQLFFKACGFEAEGTLRGHYEDTDEDAYQMVFRV